MNLAPRLATCSLAAGRTSVAVTMAPSRRAVAIACRPATPTPITKTLAAETVPAAGEIGLAREHVHRLRAAAARHQLHGEVDDARIRHRLEGGLLAVGIHDR